MQLLDAAAWINSATGGFVGEADPRSGPERCTVRIGVYLAAEQDF